MATPEAISNAERVGKFSFGPTGTDDIVVRGKK